MQFAHPARREKAAGSPGSRSNTFETIVAMTVLPGKGAVSGSVKAAAHRLNWALFKPRGRSLRSCDRHHETMLNVPNKLSTTRVSSITHVHPAFPPRATDIPTPSTPAAGTAVVVAVAIAIIVGISRIIGRADERRAGEEEAPRCGNRLKRLPTKAARPKPGRTKPARRKPGPTKAARADTRTDEKTTAPIAGPRATESRCGRRRWRRPRSHQLPLLGNRRRRSRRHGPPPKLAAPPEPPPSA